MTAVDEAYRRHIRLSGILRAARQTALSQPVSRRNLKDHPKSTRAYAWSFPVEGSDKRRVFAVLQMGAIKTPLDAIRAAIEAKHRYAGR